MLKMIDNFIVSGWKEKSEFYSRICYSFKKPFKYLSLEFEGNFRAYFTPNIGIGWAEGQFQISLYILCFTLIVLYEDRAKTFVGKLND
jgi:hypothetical protein